MADKLITDLQELDAITGDTYVPVRNAESGTRKYNLKALKDTVDAAAQAADDAATDAMAAAASVDASKEAAQQAASAANDASQRAEAAIEAIGDISELAVPLMSSTTRGGATLGSGLTVDGGALSIGDVVTDETDGPIYNVDAKGWAEQDGTPTPDNPVEVKVARGRNLYDASSRVSGKWINDTGEINSAGNNCYSEKIPVKVGDLYTFSITPVGESFKRVVAYDKNDVFVALLAKLKNGGQTTGRQTGTFIIPENTAYVRMSCNENDTEPQLELGSTPTPYVPYGHVGLEVRDSSDELVSVTPIPLPSKGFAAALPDGTADALAVDSAGRWEWTGAVGESDLGTLTWLMGTTSVSGLYEAVNTQIRNLPNGIARPSTNNNILKSLCSAYVAVTGNNTYLTSKQGISVETSGRVKIYDENYNTSSSGPGLTEFLSGIEFYYPFATPTTEHGYIDLPEVPENATIDIPELREVGVRCFVPGVSELVDHANNWGARCKQNESRIAALEAAIADLA